MGNNEKLEFQKIYFEKILDASNRAVTNRLTFLGFLITVNIAIFYAVLSKNGLTDTFNGVSADKFLYVTQFVLNFIISIVYFRENKISEVYQNVGNKLFNNGIVNDFLKQIREADKFNKGLTWSCNKTILGLLVTLPIVLFFEENLLDIDLRWIIYVIIFIFLFCGCHYKIISYIHYWIIVILFGDKLKKKIKEIKKWRRDKKN